jgi:hypothetical protein
MELLAGLQLTGQEEVVENDQNEYAAAIEGRGLSLDAFRFLAFRLHLIRVRLEEAWFLWSSFQAKELEVSQRVRV